MLRLVLPKGSLEKATFDLFEAADLPIRRSSSVDYKATIDDPRIADRAEPLAPVPGFSLWTDQFNNLLDVLKIRPLDELKGLLGLG